MDAATRQKWLTDTRRFWDADSKFQAMYRRICSSPEFDATRDQERLQLMWDDETARAVQMVTKGVPLNDDWTCLEIGCGIGRLLRPMARRCREVIGCDISSKMVQWAQEYLADTPNAEVRLNEGCSLSGIDDTSIDFVYSHLAFQHITAQSVVDAYLCEIRRVLKPGGYCRIQNCREAPKPIVESLKDLVRPLLGKQEYRSPRHWSWSQGRKVEFGGITFYPRRWRKRLRAHGLKPIATDLGLGHDFWMWTTCIRPPR
ncbi:MAG: class I SAM-dependent methyltransferase [Phycisphaerae bacterium]